MNGLLLPFIQPSQVLNCTLHQDPIHVLIKHVLQFRLLLLILRRRDTATHDDGAHLRRQIGQVVVDDRVHCEIFNRVHDRLFYLVGNEDSVPQGVELCLDHVFIRQVVDSAFGESLDLAP